MADALLTAAELRLVDLMLASNALGDVPASVVRRDLPVADPAGDPAAGPERFAALRSRLPALAALAAPCGAFTLQGSIAELLDVRARPPAGAGRAPGSSS